MRRREFLQHLLWGGAVLAAGSTVDVERLVAAASGQVDRRLVDDLHTVADDYARQMHTGVPRDLLPQVERHLAYAQAILRGPHPLGEQGRLHVIAATLAAAAGRLSVSLGNPGNAHAYYVAAEGHANEAGDGPVRAYVLGQRSWLYSDLRPDGNGTGTSMPLELLDEARAVGGDGSSPWLQTWLAACRAMEHAARGNARATHQDLDEADRFLAGASANDPLFAHWHDCSAAYFLVYRGNCMQLLGRTADATTVLEDALSGLSPSLTPVRCGVLVDLATACAKEDVERACALLMESLQLSSDGGLVAQTQRVVRVRKHLARWHETSAVRNLDERLHALT